LIGLCLGGAGVTGEPVISPPTITVGGKRIELPRIGPGESSLQIDGKHYVDVIADKHRQAQALPDDGARTRLNMEIAAIEASARQARMPARPKVGDYGNPAGAHKITQVLGPDDCLITKSSQVYWMHGWPTKDLADGQRWEPKEPAVLVCGTISYDNAGGGGSTVLVMVPLKEAHRLWREADASGGKTVSARAAEIERRIAALQAEIEVLRQELAELRKGR
jgi:hypothetical protein